jgi:hypothetical protein
MTMKTFRLLQSTTAGVSLFAGLILCFAACGTSVGTPSAVENNGTVGLTSVDQGQNLATPVVGIQDGSINDCDDYETDAGPGGVDYMLAAKALDSPLWNPLNVHTVRVTLPWDIAYHHDSTHPLADADRVLDVEQSCFNYWLATMAKKGLAPAILFRPDYNYRSQDGARIMVPSIATYRAAMKAFIDTYSCHDETCPLPALPTGFSPYPSGTGPMARVGIIAPWGEPDFHSTVAAGLPPQAPQDFYMPQDGNRFDEPSCTDDSPASCGPVLAAQMWTAVSALCPSCTVIAGDFSSAGGLEPFDGSAPTYVKTYAHALNGARPPVWGLHPYSDVEALEQRDGSALPEDQTITYRFAAALGKLGYDERTHIWFDEVNAKCIENSSDGTVTTVYGKTLENDGANYLMKKLALPGSVTAPGDPIVTRLYYMRFQDDFPGFSLVIDGAPYPPYWAIQHRNEPQQ